MALRNRSRCAPSSSTKDDHIGFFVMFKDCYELPL